MKTINIYLTMKDKKLLNEIKYKYHISYSTIASIVIPHMYILCGENLNGKIYDEKTYKTCIKPKVIWALKPNYWSNALKVFLRKQIDKYKRGDKFTYIDENENKIQVDFEKEKQIRLSKIYNKFQNTWEESWDGNREARSITRFIKKNPEYVRRLIDD